MQEMTAKLQEALNITQPVINLTNFTFAQKEPMLAALERQGLVVDAITFSDTRKASWLHDISPEKQLSQLFKNLENPQHSASRHKGPYCIILDKAWTESPNRSERPDLPATIWLCDAEAAPQFQTTSHKILNAIMGFYQTLTSNNS